MAAVCEQQGTERGAADHADAAEVGGLTALHPAAHCSSSSLLQTDLQWPLCFGVSDE